MKFIGGLILVVCVQVCAFASDTLATLHGKVVDQKTKEAVDAKVMIFYDNDIVETYSKKTEGGEFRAPLEDMGWYIISITATGYLETLDTLWVVNENATAIEKEYPVVPMEVGTTVKINNIYFLSTKATLTEDSYPELNRVVKFFSQNPHITFEIAGHTDSYGEDNYNMMLSQQRAQAVVDYLVSQGIDKAQLKAQGYGETKPVDNTGTRAGLAKNRRVEFTVLNIAEQN